MIATPQRPGIQSSGKLRPKRQDLLKEILALRRDLEALRQEKQHLQYMLDIIIQHAGLFPENVGSEKILRCKPEQSPNLPLHHPLANS